MARIVYAASGVMWRAPEWIARNFLSEVLAALRATGSHLLAHKLAELLAAQAALIDLGVLLDDPHLRAGWLHALDVAALLLGAEQAHDWNEPAAFAAFMASIRRCIDAEHTGPGGDQRAGASDAADAVLPGLGWLLDDALEL